MPLHMHAVGAYVVDARKLVQVPVGLWNHPHLMSAFGACGVEVWNVHYCTATIPHIRNAATVLLNRIRVLPQAHAATVVHDVLRASVGVNHHIEAYRLAVVCVHSRHAVVGNQVLRLLCGLGRRDYLALA